MDKELSRNGSGYYDPTAYTVLSKIQKEQERNMEFYRGDLVEFETSSGVTKVALIISANFRMGGMFVSICALQDEAKGCINVPITTPGKIMYADCGLISYTKYSSITRFLKTVTDQELYDVDSGIAKALGLSENEGATDCGKEGIEKVVEVPVDNSEELIRAKAEADVYKNLYEQLLAKVVG